MTSSGKFKVKVAKIIRDTSSKFDGPNTNMDEEKYKTRIGK
ncbi:MAG: hypothetical protein ACEY3F_04600 [Wolbachia sp.]